VADIITSCVYFLTWDVKVSQNVRFYITPVTDTWFWSYTEAIRIDYKGVKTRTSGQTLKAGQKHRASTVFT